MADSGNSYPEGDPWDCKCGVTEGQQNGGKRKMNKLQYRKYLEKKDVIELRKSASAKGVKTTTRKNGKMQYVKKDTLVNKLVNFKFS